MQCYRLTSLLRYYVVELACEVFRREGEVLGQHDLPQYVLTIALLNSLLVLVRQLLVDLLWLLRDDFVKHRDQFKELCCHIVDLHGHCVGQLLQVAFLQVCLNAILRVASIYDLE